MKLNRIIDTHAHIIDSVRFPFPDGPGYRPKADEEGTAAAYCAVLDANDVAHALLVQPSGYGYDNGAMLDALARYPRRFKAIAVIDPNSPERMLRDLAETGVVGVRFNLQSYRRDALDGPEAERLLARLASLGWFAQVAADDADWARIAAPLKRSHVKVLVDHFGLSSLAAGVVQPGFAAVLDLGRTGNAAVKLSAPFRLSERPDDFSDLDPFVETLVAAFGIENCIWGSDWPFLGLPRGVGYEAALRGVERWLDTPDRRAAVFQANPARLFGFGD
jgi:predicted TIM-barrel fold metal-dependent hydrolase